jgi:dienelactone hydrolase
MKHETRIRILLPALVLGLAAIVYAAGYLLPTDTRVERVTYIDISPEVLYGLINDLERFKDWAPWQGRDPKIQYTVEQPARGLGAALRWESEDSSLGEGRLSIIDAQPYSKLRMLLEIGGDERAVLAYRLEPLEDGTHIEWTLEMDHGANPVRRYQGLLAKRRLDSLLKPGLDHLRRLSERQPALSAVDVVTQELDYKVDGQSFTGFLAYDRNRRQSPGVLIVHEWWGHDDYVRKRAGQLAGLGYVALALDMYGGGKHAKHPDEAGRMAGEVKKNFETARARFMAALETLRDHPATDRERLAAIGYCFGGNIVLNMARAGVDLDGVVSFHGTLDAIAGPARQGEVKAGMLVLNGADDPMVPPEQLQAFMEEMDRAGVDYELINYPGATHAFTNPEADNYAKQFNLPLAYNADADQQSWQKMRDFFARIFR